MNARAIYRVSHSRTFTSRTGGSSRGSVERKVIPSRRSIASHVRRGVESAILTWPAVDKRTNDILPYRVADSEAHLRFNGRYDGRYRRATRCWKRRVTVRHNVIPRQASSAESEGLSKNIFIIPRRTDRQAVGITGGILSDAGRIGMDILMLRYAITGRFTNLYVSR